MIELTSLAKTGGGFRIDASKRTTTDLIQIAAAAKEGGARVFFAGMSTRSGDELLEIARVAAGRVVFED